MARLAFALALMALAIEPAWAQVGPNANNEALQQMREQTQAQEDLAATQRQMLMEQEFARQREQQRESDCSLHLYGCDHPQ